MRAPSPRLKTSRGRSDSRRRPRFILGTKAPCDRRPSSAVPGEKRTRAIRQSLTNPLASYLGSRSPSLGDVSSSPSFPHLAETSAGQCRRRGVAPNAQWAPRFCEHRSHPVRHRRAFVVAVRFLCVRHQHRLV
ncbi:hypothetical protein MRX96_003823 [Rhipicephalus microplus]